MSVNKTILITGASGNLGNYLANYYLLKKFNVIEISKKIHSNIGPYSYICDLSNPAKTKTLFKKLKKKFKKIDFVISCAGVSKKTYKINENMNDWIIAFNNNFYCFTNLLENYLDIYKRKSTKIVVISSIASCKVTNAPITYSVAKSALNFYAQTKAKEVAKNDIKINILLPGNILMPNNNWSIKFKKNPKEINRYIKKNVPLNKFCNPKQIGEMCDYLFSEAGDNITGSKFVIDGGESI